MLCLVRLSHLQAQEIGVRIGNGNASNIHFDAVFAFGQFDRIHTDVSFEDEKLGIDALLDFIYKPVGEQDFNWYAGAGPFLVMGGEFRLGATGEVGLEYHFREIPMAIGMDWRPAFQFVGDTDLALDRFGINFRFVFKH